MINVIFNCSIYNMVNILEVVVDIIMVLQEVDYGFVVVC